MNAGLNILDIVFLLVVFLSILFGVIKGFIREIFSLIFLVLAVILSFLFYYEAGTFLMKYIDSRQVASFAGFISIFTVVLIIGAVVTYFVKKILTVGPLKSVDRILGGVFGLLRGILISGVIVFALVAFPTDDNLLVKSRLSPYIADTIDVFLKLLPEDVRKEVDSFHNKQDKKKGNHDGKKNTGTGRTI
jgi:membrane protein required for colicin V production